MAKRSTGFLFVKPFSSSRPYCIQRESCWFWVMYWKGLKKKRKTVNIKNFILRLSRVLTSTEINCIIITATKRSTLLKRYFRQWWSIRRKWGSKWGKMSTQTTWRLIQGTTSTFCRRLVKKTRWQRWEWIRRRRLR